LQGRPKPKRGRLVKGGHTMQKNEEPAKTENRVIPAAATMPLGYGKRGQTFMGRGELWADVESSGA